MNLAMVHAACEGHTIILKLIISRHDCHRDVSYVSELRHARVIAEKIDRVFARLACPLIPFNNNLVYSEFYLSSI